MIGVFDLVGTLCSGWLTDRYDPRWLLFWYYGLRGLSLLVAPVRDRLVAPGADRVRRLLRARLGRDRAADGRDHGRARSAASTSASSSAGSSAPTSSAPPSPPGAPVRPAPGSATISRAFVTAGLLSLARVRSRDPHRGRRRADAAPAGPSPAEASRMKRRARLRASPSSRWRACSPVPPPLTRGSPGRHQPRGAPCSTGSPARRRAQASTSTSSRSATGSRVTGPDGREVAAGPVRRGPRA